MQPKPAVITKEKNTVMAVIAYVVFFIPLLTLDKNDQFVKFHIKQGMILFVAWFAAIFASMIPFIGQILSPVLSLALIVLMVVGIKNACQGLEKPLPFIGKYAASFKI